MFQEDVYSNCLFTLSDLILRNKIDLNFWNKSIGIYFYEIALNTSKHQYEIIVYSKQLGGATIEEINLITVM